MKLKSIALLALVLLVGAFVFLKIEVSGEPNSNFNQTTRLKLGKYPLARLVLGLHNYGDARAELFNGRGPITIQWFRPQLEEIDTKILKNFADAVRIYTGRSTQLQFGGLIDEKINKESELSINKFFGKTFSSTNLYVFLTDDYRPREKDELSSTLAENGIIVSLAAHRQYLQAYPERVNDYLYSSLLHEFGHQLGLEHPKDLGDPGCVMLARAPGALSPIATGRTVSDFCKSEQNQIAKMKLRFSN